MPPGSTRASNIGRAGAKGLTQIQSLVAKVRQNEAIFELPFYKHSKLNHIYHVVSEKLCDDALRLLKPSLKKYRRCTIIDCNPGIGLWSEKVHTLLKPRAHLLLEPQWERFTPFLEPLLKRVGSKYHHVNLTFYASAMKKGDFIKPLEELARGSSGAPVDIDLDAPILVLVNAAHGTDFSLKSAKRAISRTHSTMDNFVFEWLQLLYKARGPNTKNPARLLIWSYTEDKTNVLPRNILGRQGMAPQLDELYEVREIVGGKEFTGPKRLSNLDIRSAILTARRMQKSGIELPKGRRSDLHEVAVSIQEDLIQQVDGASAFKKAISDSGEPIGLIGELAAFEKLERGLYTGAFDRYKECPPGEDKRLAYESDDFIKLESLRNRLDLLAHGKLASQAHDYGVIISVHGLAELNRYERVVAAKRCRGEDTTEEELHMQQLLSKIEEQKEHFRSNGRYSNRSRTANMDIDNVEAFAEEPPLLAWDRREFEPLETSEDEFFPNHKLALIDFKPRPTTRVGVIDVRAQPLLRTLGIVPATSISKLIDGIENGAAQAMLPNCPSLYDPLRGGRLHLDNLRYRMLTTEMCREILNAWESWPGRQSDEILRKRTEFRMVPANY